MHAVRILSSSVRELPLRMQALEYEAAICRVDPDGVGGTELTAGLEAVFNRSALKAGDVVTLRYDGRLHRARLLPCVHTGRPHQSVRPLGV